MSQKHAMLLCSHSQQNKRYKLDKPKPQQKENYLTKWGSAKSNQAPNVYCTV